ncbi:Alkaline phosphatase-like, alpha/beta/alpha domain-containing protein [Rozella allomycis CSF55]|uniref:Alkaline phosphatase n=1 Tax=Rozella allomycis (strain CSF55) TaxID=988480 RepID=A0A075B0K8_ROZAC|nr:Alkaline phosphatase-like, alpha/beta/alpha domain-containing protein [Rozella allomycis CSF55]|eukprot:EPZ36061.1 Alkaline phosphatase-like, alpha/beta/alpha domain-containing protein [Rozella allomycis CSF55]
MFAGSLVILVLSSNPINVILMISDGFGPSSETFGRTIYQFKNNLPFDHPTPLDEILVGTSRTRSSSSLVTDSAAGATAFSCGLKSYNGAIGVNPNKKPCGTIFEAAKAKGLKTGLVATSRITHATPASFSAHVVHRDMENLIAEYQVGDYILGPQIDLMFGGGRCHFVSNITFSSCRNDDRNLLKEASDKGYHVINNKYQMMTTSQLPVIGLFNNDHMSFEIDRIPDQEPSLSEMTKKALDLLAVDSENGFILMVEGSRIGSTCFALLLDMAAHNNDPVGHASDILEYYETVKLAKIFVENHPSTLLISVSDHETGGLSLAKQLDPDKYPIYKWLPKPILKAKNSIEYLALRLVLLKNENFDDLFEYIDKIILRHGLMIDEPLLNDINQIVSATRTGNVYKIMAELSKIISTSAQIGWSTHGHSAVDVNLYATGYESHKLKGNIENTAIGNFIADLLNLDLQNITSILNKHDTVPSVKDVIQVRCKRIKYHS